MAKEIVVKTIFQFKRGLSTSWTEKNPVLYPGEPGYELDTGKLKIGHDDLPWNSLSYFNGDYSVSPDNNSLQINQEGKITLYGFDGAEIGQVPSKGENGTIEWIDRKDLIKIGSNLIMDEEGRISVSDNLTAQVNNATLQASNAADRASQSAIIAGNYAADAIQAKNAIDNKIWYGTMQEYNALQTVSNSTIYIILHE